MNTELSPVHQYDDVSATTQYETSIQALTTGGVVSGDTDINGHATGTFRPTDRINRAEVAKMVMEARAKYGTPGKGRTPNGTSSSIMEENLVTYTDSGFSPQVLHIKQGDSVQFKNDSSGGMWVASNPHPTHTDLSGFDALRAYGEGEVYIYTFTKIGTFGYHNHLHPESQGTIVVE